MCVTGDVSTDPREASAMRLPHLSALRVRERGREEEEVGFPLDLPYLDPSAALSVWSNLKEYLYPFTRCEDSAKSNSKTVTPTSKLWEDRLLNTTEMMKYWKHKDRLVDIRDFFIKAGQANVDSLAHVVLVRKQYDKTDVYPEGCKATTGINSCYHGHIAVVFEPLFQPSSGELRDVVSLGFFPRGGDPRNLIPGYVGDGVLQSPDAMVSAWRDELAQGSWDAKMENHMVILETFSYSPEKMARWATVMEDRAEQMRWEARHAGIHDVLYGGFDFYSGVSAVTTGREVVKSIAGGLSAMTTWIGYLDHKLAEVSRPDKAFNCATWMLDAFPEANLVCTAGMPRLCRRRGDLFQSLEAGLFGMVESAAAMSAQIVKRSYAADDDDVPGLDEVDEL